MEPIGASELVLVAVEFNSYVEETSPHKESLEIKFAKLTNIKRPTGDPSWPPSVQRAKHIARDILAKVYIGPIEGTSQIVWKDTTRHMFFQQVRQRFNLDPATIRM